MRIIVSHDMTARKTAHYTERIQRLHAAVDDSAMNFVFNCTIGFAVTAHRIIYFRLPIVSSKERTTSHTGIFVRILSYLVNFTIQYNIRLIKH